MVAGHGSWDGIHAADLANRLGLPYVAAYDVVDSTMNVALANAARCVTPGWMVLADGQQSGRGRMGRSWSSPPGSGVWCTIIEKPEGRGALDVLSLRVGLLLAESLSALAAVQVGVKWPNDLTYQGRKLAGVLTEAQWAGSTLSHVAVGVGVNVASPPDVPGAAALPGVSRLDVLGCVVQAVRAAGSARGHLTAAELARYRERDILLGRRLQLPARGIARGISDDGSLLVASDADGRETGYRSGRAILAEELP